MTTRGAAIAHSIKKCANRFAIEHTNVCARVPFVFNGPFSRTDNVTRLHFYSRHNNFYFDLATRLPRRLHGALMRSSVEGSFVGDLGRTKKYGVSKSARISLDGVCVGGMNQQFSGHADAGRPLATPLWQSRQISTSRDAQGGFKCIIHCYCNVARTRANVARTCTLRVHGKISRDAIGTT